jgi:hypothetical protein
MYLSYSAPKIEATYFLKRQLSSDGQHSVVAQKKDNSPCIIIRQNSSCIIKKTELFMYYKKIDRTLHVL